MELDECDKKRVTANRTLNLMSWPISTFYRRLSKLRAEFEKCQLTITDYKNYSSVGVEEGGIAVAEEQCICVATQAMNVTSQAFLHGA